MDFPKNTEIKPEDNLNEKPNSALDQEDHPLLDQVSNLVGLPTEWVESELSKLVSQSGHDLSKMTLEDLRAITLNYLNDMDFQFQEQQESDLVFLENAPAKTQ